ncbi:MAG: hypothetical protein HQL24_10055 [Candidatus Omnitrophica bacterium]|nr:hypothetical protein [Candidatus Omnitrophota bacterium]
MLKNLKTLKNNEDGMVFIVVIAIIMAMMILVISIISVNTSQVTSTESEVRRIQAEILAAGALDYTLTMGSAGATSLDNLFIENLDGTTFSAKAGIDPINATLNSLNISINY